MIPKLIKEFTKLADKEMKFLLLLLLTYTVGLIINSRFIIDAHNFSQLSERIFKANYFFCVSVPYLKRVFVWSH